MLFYHCFYTDLPDQFVEANARRLIDWTDGWSKSPYLVRSRIIDNVSIDLIGNHKRDQWPTIKCGSQPMLKLWMNNKGGNYDGGYWGTLAEDQRSPARISSDPGRDDTFAAWLAPGSVWFTGSPVARAKPARSGLGALGGVSLRQMLVDMEDKPKPPLKRDGVIAGEIVGFRCWKIDRGLLRSVYQKDVWHPGQVLAGRELGDWDQRGIHAWKDAGSKQYHDYIRAYLNDQSDPFRRFIVWGGQTDIQVEDARPAMVTGTVFLWGDVVEHERGWRAEFARVRSLDWLYPDETMMGREQEALDDLRRRYTVNG